MEGETARPLGQVVLDLETSARQIGAQLDRVLAEFHGTLRGITALSVDTIHVYTTAVHGTCDAVDASIKALYQLLAKYEELSRSLRGVGELAAQVREIKRILDLFESHLLQLPPPSK